MDMGPCFGAVQRYPGKYLGLGILFLLVTCRSPQACSDLIPSHVCLSEHIVYRVMASMAIFWPLPLPTTSYLLTSTSYY